MVALLQTSECPLQNTRHARGQVRTRTGLGSIRSMRKAREDLSESIQPRDAQLGSCSRDPIGYVDGLNNYRAYFMPSGVDPSGLMWGWGDFVNHYYNGHGRAVTLSEMGLADYFESYFASRIDRDVRESLARAKAIPTHCNNGAGSYNASNPLRTITEFWARFNITLYPLGRVTMAISFRERKYWICERCCTRELQVTWWHAETDVRFAMADGFQNPLSFGSDPWQNAYKQGQCVHKCWEKYGTKVGGYIPCRDACRAKYPTEGDDGIPFGIFHTFWRNAFDTYEKPCGTEQH